MTRDTSLRDEDARVERTRLQRRSAFLVRKARRLPLNSNGRRKAMEEAAMLSLRDSVLSDALAGGNPTKLRLPLGRSRHAHRADMTIKQFAPQ